MRPAVFCIGLVCLFMGCQPAVTTQPAFYHWQTAVHLDHTEQSMLQELGIQRLYVKYFDVDWNFSKNLAVPLASAKLDTASLKKVVEMVPTIFITNRTFVHLTHEEVAVLAKKIYQKIKRLHPTQLSLKEIQIDCDWSSSTRDKYFHFLQALKQGYEKEEVRISATIRLHQVKYFEQTGIPPVDKGMLMYYNMGELEKWEEPNSILNNSTGQRYTNRLREYPLRLDLALPIYSWGVVFRGDKFLKLINQLEYTDLEAHESIVKIAPNRFKLLKSTYLKGYYLYKGDQIRLENCTIRDLQKAVQLLSSDIQPQYLSFYHLDSTVIKHISYDQLENLCSGFN
ncbi:MAG: hypothetical protein MK226_01480 [Saprospiraceae bacterium]|nr:hypothetical protein [Saprospiraceae bacterium]